jgi:hypothetical protein
VLSNFSEHLGLIIFSALVLSWLVETILSSTWNKTYFTSGIPIFVMRIPVKFQRSNIPSVRQLDVRFYSTWASSLVFKEIDLHTYGFREKFFEFRLFRYSSIMHGVLVFEHNNHEVIVKGFANWFIVSFSLIWIGGVILSSFSSPSLIAVGFILFFVLLMGLLYSIQHHRYSKVATFAAETWSTKYTKGIVEANQSVQPTAETAEDEHHFDV